MIPKNTDIRIEISTKCNYKCAICPREKLSRKEEIMSLGLFTALVDKIAQETKQYNTITFPGLGEPLLDETLFLKIVHARKKDFSILILTNGSLLDVKKFQEFQSLGVSSVRVSFYGVTKEQYAAMHGIKAKGAFERVKNNLLAIAKARTRTKLILTLNITDGYESSVQEWVNFWKGKVDLVEVWRPHNWVYGRSYRSVQAYKLTSCGRPFTGPLQVQVDGTINMCCFDFDGKLTLGDLKKQTLEEIFSSPLFIKILECHSRGDFKGSGLICEQCDQRNKDKADVMIYNSGFDIKDRVWMTSTTYEKIA